MDTRQLAERAVEAFNAHDVAAIRELTADDCTHWSAGGTVARGRDECVAANTMWFEACSDAKITVTRLAVEGNVAYEEGIFEGTHDGVLKTPMGDVPATGRTLRGEYVTVTEVRDGKAVAQRLYFDRMQVAEQLGLLPAATGA